MKSYIKTLFILCVLTALIFNLAIVSSKQFVVIFEDAMHDIVKEETVSLTVPSVLGAAMGVEWLYHIDDRDETKQNLYILGNSQSILGLIESQVEENLNVQFINGGMGSANIDSYILMNNYWIQSGNEPQSGDVVIIDITYSLFQERPLATNVTASSLTYGNIYSIENDLSIHDDVFRPFRQYLAMGSKSIESALNHLVVLSTQGSVISLYQLPDTEPKGLEQTMTLDAGAANRLQDLIASYQDNGVMVILEYLYQSDTFKNSEAGALLNDYIDNLSVSAHAIVDYRLLLSDTFFVDMNHLKYSGREYYTHLMIEDLNTILNRGIRCKENP